MLHWNRDFGEKVEHWERYIDAGGRAPDQFYERPEISGAEACLWRAFVDLGTERQIGMGLGPIPRSAGTDYAREIGITGDRFDRFWSIISAVDAEYLRLANASPDEETEPQPTKRPAAKPISQSKAT